MNETRHRTQIRHNNSQPCTVIYKSYNKWVGKKNKQIEKNNTNAVCRKRGWTKRSEGFKKLMVGLIISFLTILLSKKFSLGFNIYQWHF